MIVLLLEESFFVYAKKCFPATKIIAPFGLHGIFLQELLKPENNFGRNTKIITKKEYKQELLDLGFNAVAWNDIHAKLLIGTNGLLFGSWNFHLEHETKATQREMVFYISNQEPLFQILNERFSEWFEQAGKWQKWTKPKAF